MTTITKKQASLALVVVAFAAIMIAGSFSFEHRCKSSICRLRPL